jgi:predicted metal-dependent hydrolase
MRAFDIGIDAPSIMLNAGEIGPDWLERLSVIQTDTQRILPGDPPLSVTLKRSAQARRLSLRVSQLDGRVTLSVPQKLSERVAMAFLAEKEGWVRSALAGLPATTPVRPGSEVLLHGLAYLVREGGVRAVTLDDGALIVPPDPTGLRSGPRVAAWLRLRAQQHLTEASLRHATTLGRSFQQITMRDPRGRWGSCTSDGRLMYSWRLIMAPPAVMDYVAAHEVAHLVEMNHSPAYWANVRTLMPDFKPRRDWLKLNGQQLHRFTFRVPQDARP